MRRRWLIGMVVCAQYVHTVYAQTWSKEDSIRLANILSGRDTLRLNPEFQRSIQNGTFINLNPVGKMKSASSKVPFTKDFSEYIKLDKSVLVEEKKSWKDMPPQAAMREPIEVKEPDLKVNPLVYTIPGQVKQTAVKPTGHDFNDFLSYLLSPKYRQFKKNASRNTYKIYNDIPALQIYQKQKKFREEHPELILKPDSQVTKPKKKALIGPVLGLH